MESKKIMFMSHTCTEKNPKDINQNYIKDLIKLLESENEKG